MTWTPRRSCQATDENTRWILKVNTSSNTIFLYTIWKNLNCESIILSDLSQEKKLYYDEYSICQATLCEKWHINLF